MSAPQDELGKGMDSPRVPIRIERALAALTMAVVCLITFANVAVRYLTNYSFAFTEEFSVFLMVVMTLIGAAAAFGGNHHIRMTMLADKFPTRIRKGVELLVSTLGLGLFAMLIWLGARLTWDDFSYHTTSPGMGLPQWIYTVWLPLLSIVIALRIVGHMIRVSRRKP